MPARTGRKAKQAKALDNTKAAQPIAAGIHQIERERVRSTLAVQRTAPTLRMLALEKLRKAIIDGELPPNTRLIERQLCDLLGVSRTIVREILRQLEAEGWVTNPPYKGPTVAA